MKVYKVKVNGKVYEVELESVSINEKHIEAPQQAAPATQAAPVSGDGQKINAPMAGTINDVKVSVGQQVKEGDVLFILEAMKLENEIVAPCNGTVKSVAVTKGASVQNGQLIAIIG